MIVPVVVAGGQPPVVVTVYVNVPLAVGVPLIVTTFADQEPVTPAGKPVTVAPVAPVVPRVIVVIGELIQTVWLVPGATVFKGVTVIVPVVVAGGQPPVVVTVYVNVPLAVGVPLIVTTFADQEPVTPAGKPVTVAPVAPVVPRVIVVIGELIQTVWLVPGATVFKGVTVIVPVVVAGGQPPVVVTVYVNVPLAVGVPLMVTTFAAQEPVTPAGKPVTVAPVAPVVAKVMLVKAELIQTVRLMPAATVFKGVTVIVPVVVAGGQPPVVVTVYVNVPLAVGVPLIVTTFPAQDPVTPAGKPVTVAPVAPVVANVMLVNGELIQTV